MASQAFKSLPPWKGNFVPRFHVKWIQIRVSAKVCSLANVRGGLKSKPRIPQTLNHSLSCIKADRFIQSTKFNSEPQTWCCWPSTDSMDFRSTQQKGNIKKNMYFEAENGKWCPFMSLAKYADCQSLTLETYRKKKNPVRNFLGVSEI